VGIDINRLYCLHDLSLLYLTGMPPSSRGLGHRPFKPATWIRIPLGAFKFLAGGSDAGIQAKDNG
jgi:hypothetical protein